MKSLLEAARRSQAVPTLAEGGEGAGLRDRGLMGRCNMCALHVAEYKSGGGPIEGGAHEERLARRWRRCARREVGTARAPGYEFPPTRPVMCA